MLVGPNRRRRLGARRPFMKGKRIFLMEPPKVKGLERALMVFVSLVMMLLIMGTLTGMCYVVVVFARWLTGDSWWPFGSYFS